MTKLVDQVNNEQWGLKNSPGFEKYHVAPVQRKKKNGFC